MLPVVADGAGFGWPMQLRSSWLGLAAVAGMRTGETPEVQVARFRVEAVEAVPELRLPVERVAPLDLAVLSAATAGLTKAATELVATVRVAVAATSVVAVVASSSLVVVVAVARVFPPSAIPRWFRRPSNQ